MSPRNNRRDDKRRPQASKSVRFSDSDIQSSGFDYAAYAAAMYPDFFPPDSSPSDSSSSSSADYSPSSDY